MSSNDCKALFYSGHRSKSWMHSRSAWEKSSSSTLRTSRRSRIRGGFLHQDGEAQTAREHSHAQRSVAGCRHTARGGHTARDPEAQLPALRRPSGSRAPPSSPALAPLLLLGSRARMRSFFFFGVSIKKNFFLLKEIALQNFAVF